MNIMETDILRLKNVSKEYSASGEAIKVLSNISFEASQGELSLLLGPSGSGKTTFLSLIAGFTRPTSGSISLFGNDIQSHSARMLAELRALHIGFVFQNFLLIDSLTVEDNIELVQTFARRVQKRSEPAKKGVDSQPFTHRSQSVLELLERFGIASLRRRYPPQLSQGERQRVALVRAIANNARLILADEPTASLQAEQGLEVIKLLVDLAIDDRRTIIVASHDTRLASFASRTIELHGGQLKEIRN
jgi:putative ABC transport system ATP-binding protein